MVSDLYGLLFGRFLHGWKRSLSSSVKADRAIVTSEPKPLTNLRNTFLSLTRYDHPAIQPTVPQGLKYIPILNPEVSVYKRFVCLSSPRSNRHNTSLSASNSE